MSRSRRAHAEIMPRSRRTPPTLTPRCAGFSARATRTAGTRSSATSCATRSTQCSASPSTPPSHPCPLQPTDTPLASDRGERQPQVRISGPLPRRPRLPRPGAMDSRDGRNRAEHRVRSARQIAPRRRRILISAVERSMGACQLPYRIIIIRTHRTKTKTRRVCAVLESITTKNL